MAEEMTLEAAIGIAVHRDKNRLGRVAGGTAATGPALSDHRVARSRRGGPAMYLRSRLLII
jgi:hypothetical protein